MSIHEKRASFNRYFDDVREPLHYRDGANHINDDGCAQHFYATDAINYYDANSSGARKS